MREDDARGAPQCRQTARFRASRGRLAGSIACDLHEVRFVVVEDAQRRDPASTVAHQIAQMTPEQRAQDALDLVARARQRLAEYRQTIEHEPAPEDEK